MSYFSSFDLVIQLFCLNLQLSQEALHSRWAHSIPSPEKGCLLLAHPLVFLGRQKYFHQAAILILGESPVDAGDIGNT